MLVAYFKYPNPLLYLMETELEFQELDFKPYDKDKIRVNFHNRFYFDLDTSKIASIAPFEINENKIIFRNISENTAKRRFSELISSSISTDLRHSINKKRTIYIHSNSSIPLIGTPYFGIIDRNSNVLEIRPNTGCNFNCIYCSVDEGFISKRLTDYFVEKDYMVSELKKIVEFKECKIDIHIGSQGEPTLYPDMIELIRGIREIPNIRHISMVTNGSLLTKEYVDQLAESGLSRINLSLNTLDFKMAQTLAGINFDIKRVVEIAKYIPTTNMDLIIAPLWVPGYNDDFLELVRFAKNIAAGKIGPAIGIQNFMTYKRGRNPVSDASTEEFNKKMRDIEQKEGIKLIYDVRAKHETQCKSLPKPFKRGEIVKAELKMPGRFRNEVIGVSKDRCVSIIGCNLSHIKLGSIVKARVIRTKHNIFTAKYIGNF